LEIYQKEYTYDGRTPERYTHSVSYKQVSHNKANVATYSKV